jgi:signal peptidase I
MENPAEVTDKALERKKIAIEWLKDIIIAVVIAVVIVQFIKPTIVKESSMEPNFYSNDYLFINKMAYKFNHTPKKGDVIVFKSNLTTDTGKKKLLIKRVIGLPGDHIDIKNGKVYINGKEDSQSYTMSGETIGSIDGLTIPKGKLFCMGDNRDVSIDSRYEEVGCVSESKVVGKVIFRLFPFNKIGVIKNPYK